MALTRYELLPQQWNTLGHCCNTVDLLEYDSDFLATILSFARYAVGNVDCRRTPSAPRGSALWFELPSSYSQSINSPLQCLACWKVLSAIAGQQNGKELHFLSPYTTHISCTPKQILTYHLSNRLKQSDFVNILYFTGSWFKGIIHSASWFQYE